MTTKEVLPSSRHVDAPWVGMLAVMAAMALYAGNFVFSRYSVTTDMSEFDLLALRYGIAGVLMLPYFLRQKVGRQGGVSWRHAVGLAFFAGIPYMLLMFSGLKYSPASHGAVLNPGMVPIVVAIGLWISAGVALTLRKILALLLIIAGLAMVMSFSLQLKNEIILGDGLLLLSGMTWGVFTILVRRWSVPPMTVAAIVSVVSLVYLPVYVVFFDSHLASVPVWHLLSQGVYQGVITAIVAMYLYAYGIRIIGAQTAALFSPLVPIFATFAAVFMLGELPGIMQWLGMLLVIGGMYYVARMRT